MNDPVRHPVRRCLRQQGTLALCALWVAAAPAAEPPEALYRSDLPPVLTPPVAATRLTPQQAGEFQIAYRRLGRPRVLVFWNRELSDSTFQKTVKTTVTASMVRKQASVEELLPGEYEAQSSRAATKVHTEIVDRIPEPGRSTLPGERLDAQVKTGFMTAMLSSGVRLVDRNLPLRALAAGSVAPPELDAQTLEMKVLSKYADVLMEVVSVPDREASVGWGLRVTLKNVADGSLLVSHYESGAELLQAVRYVADPEVGIKRQLPRAQDLGATTALTVLQQWAERAPR